MIFLGVFLLIWFGIVVVIVVAALVFAILATVYTEGGPRALSITLVILAALAALLITLGLRNRGVEPDLASWFAAKSRRERWFLIAVAAVGGATMIKATWNLVTDPPGVTRPCVWCSPYVPYQGPEPPPREPQK
jgi:hypothetical protein